MEERKLNTKNQETGTWLIDVTAKSEASLEEHGTRTWWKKSSEKGIVVVKTKKNEFKICKPWKRVRMCIRFCSEKSVEKKAWATALVYLFRRKAYSRGSGVGSSSLLVYIREIKNFFFIHYLGLEKRIKCKKFEYNMDLRVWLRIDNLRKSFEELV